MKSATLMMLLVCTAVYESAGQGEVSAGFSFPADPYSVCIDEPVRIRNTSQNALGYLWDLCPERFTESPVISESIAVTGLTSGWGYKVINHGGQWTGFLIGRNPDKLFRLEFGDHPSNNPVIFDLGNPGNLLVSPQGLDIVNQNGNWYGFVGKGQTTSGQIVRLDFGNDLHNDPTAVGLGTFGFSGRRFRDLKIIRQGTDWILAVILDTQQALLRINYGDSFDNILSADNIRTTTALEGADLPLGFSIVKYRGNWIVHTVSYSNHSIQQYNFGNDIMGGPSFEGSFSFTSLFRPYYIKVIREADSFYGLVGNESKRLSIIDFGDFTSLPEQLPNTTLPPLIAFDVLKADSKNIVQGTITNSSSFTQFSFENTSCGSPVTFSNTKSPPPFSFSSPGAINIELLVTGSDFQQDVASAALTVSGFNAPSIDVSHDNMCVATPIQFAVASVADLTGWEWDLGNGITSMSENPTSSYAAEGSYEVLLMARDGNGCRAYDTLTLRIYQSPLAAFDVPSALLCTNNTLIFPTTTTDIYNGNLSYQWFVDDNPVSNDRDLRYAFATTGPKQIKLITSIPGCSGEITKTTSNVESGPAVDFSFTGTCEGDLFAFRQQISDPVESYQWDFGNGNTSAEPDATNQFTSFGDYAVSLSATNAVGCKNIKTHAVTVESKPVIDFSAEGPPNACSGSPTRFVNKTTNPDGRAISAWRWDFMDAGDPLPASDKDPVHTFQTPDTYTVALQATTAAGCVATGSQDIAIRRSPSTGFAVGPVCLNVPVDFAGPADPDIIATYWEIGTSYYNTSSPTHTFKSAGDYPLYLELISSNGCVATLAETIHVPVALAPDFSVVKNCAGAQAVLTDITAGADAVVAREWLLNGTETLVGSPVTHSFTQTGDQAITLKVATASGCYYSIKKKVEIVSAPEASFAPGPASGAFPLEVNFINTSRGAVRYQWQFGDETGTTSAETSPVHIFHTAGTYEVLLTAISAQECEDDFTGVITAVPPLPDAVIEMISLTPNADGSLKLIVTIHNKGNTILKDAPLEVNFSGNLVLRQPLDAAVLPGTKHNVVFNTGIVNDRPQPYLCVSMNVQNDLFPDDNRFCNEFRGTTLALPAYPNPTSSVLRAEWISPAAVPVRISLFDTVGKSVFSHEKDGLQGFNYQNLDLSGLQQGIYFLVIEDGVVKHHQRILLVREK